LLKNTLSPSANAHAIAQLVKNTYTLFFLYKNNFIRTRGSLTIQPQQKNKVSNFQLK